jgi:hypothetical protein
MLYCQGLKHHKPELQLKHWRITTGLGGRCHDILVWPIGMALFRQRILAAPDTYPGHCSERQRSSLVKHLPFAPAASPTFHMNNAAWLLP